jgi:hypothetical protein
MQIINRELRTVIISIKDFKLEIFLSNHMFFVGYENVRVWVWKA